MPTNETALGTLRQESGAAVDLLADLFENSAVGVHLQDAEGRILHANATLASLAGCTPAQMQGRRFAEFLADPDAAAQMAQQLSAGDSVTNIETAIVRRDASRRDVLVSANAL